MKNSRDDPSVVTPPDEDGLTIHSQKCAESVKKSLDLGFSCNEVFSELLLFMHEVYNLDAESVDMLIPLDMMLEGQKSAVIFALATFCDSGDAWPFKSPEKIVEALVLSQKYKDQSLAMKMLLHFLSQTLELKDYEEMEFGIKSKALSFETVFEILNQE